MRQTSELQRSGTTGFEPGLAEGRSETARTSGNRRERPRAKLDWILYLNLSSGNGGIVLDISEKGFSLQTADPMEASGPTRFRFLAPSIEQVEVGGEIRWMDETRKRAGVLFTDVQAHILDEVRGWIKHSPISDSPSVAAEAKESSVGPTSTNAVRVPLSETISSRPPEVQNPLPSNTNLEQTEVARAPKSRMDYERRDFPEPVRPQGASVWRNSTRRGDSNAEAASADFRTSAEDFPERATSLYAQPMEDRLAPSHWSATLLLVLAVVAALGLIGFVYRPEVGSGLVTLGQTIAGKSAASQNTERNANPPFPAAASAPATSISAQPSNAAAGANTATARSGPSLETRSHTPGNDPHAAKEANPLDNSAVRGESFNSGHSGRAQDSDALGDEDTVNSEYDGEAELKLARQYLSDGRSAEAADVLWEAVGKGSPEAEVELADLYGRGQGVKKNCAQARVLVNAAGEKNDVLADQESTALRALGCG